ncbi:AMP-binding protein [Williamsia deligens]|uniref:AMP-binding protein n=1 Tax=Williamsia deligens TaxID=321325 RepID=A0ABW3G416_9NOCA|nr:alpha/beta fold hydrolase [Williamsia deligens]MCP2194497.1 Acyl-CoA synthetase (AMP-forming)/AMP-acid ligase II [Williamsia deligens]
MGHSRSQKQTVTDILVDAATRFPDAEAIVAADGRVTYSELLARASATARALGDADRRPVAVVTDDTLSPVVVMFGALLAGRAVVPLDSHLPPERIAAIVARAGAEVVDALAIHARADGPDTSARLEDAATIIFTSGSTGEPKGVVFDHENAVGKAVDAVVGQDLGPGDRIADVLPLGFSAGSTTLLAGVAACATVLLADPRRMGVEPVLAWLEAERATTLNSSVSLVRRLATAVRDGTHPPLTTLRQITFYGEPSNGADVVLARHLAAPAPSVVNWYGATEAGVVGSTVIAPDDDVAPGRVVAGRALGDRVVMICDDDGHSVPDGTTGEVVVYGGTIAQGYVGGTSDRFLDDPELGRGYRTGDRGLLDATQRLHVIGRADDAVKVRGYLVEPAEVEVAITAIPGVEEVFVRGHDVDGQNELIAYVGGSTGGLEVRVRSHAADTLPPWMVPRFVVVLAALPRTDRGKVDRAALPPPPPTTDRRRRRRTTDVVESAVRLAVTAALGHDDVDADQDLVAMGVDSLSLARIAVTLRQVMNVEVDLAAFAASPTIATLADGLRRANENATADSGDGVLVPLRTDGDGAPLFLIAGAGAPASAFIPLVRALPPTRPVYGLQARGLERPGRPDRTITAMARRNVDLVMSVQPQGPYELVGHSMGGVVAAEMAAQFADRGEAVSGVQLIDSALTPSLLGELAVGDVDADDEVHFGMGGPQLPVMSMTNRQLAGLFLRLPLVGREVFDPVTQWIVFYHRGARMVRRHRLRRIDAPVVALCAEGSTHRRSLWAAVSSAPVALVAVPGGHVDLLHEPHVSALARAVAEGSTQTGTVTLPRIDQPQ